MPFSNALGEGARQLLDLAATRAIRRLPTEAPKLIISGAPRSGTTWLAESLSELLRYFLVSEPMEPSAHPEVLDLGFGWDLRIPPNEPLDLNDRRHAYLDGVFSLRTRAANLWNYLGARNALSSYARAASLLAPRGVVYKLVRANMMLGFLLRTFDLKGLLLIRHPCAVIASQQRMAWQGALAWKDRWIPFLTEFRPELVRHVKSIRTPAEVLAWDWAIPYLVALADRDPRRCRVVFYEDLFVDWEATLSQVVAFGGIGRLNGRIHRYRRRLSTSHIDAEGVELTKWRRTLQPDDVSRILEVAAISGLDFYSRDGGPVRRLQSD